MSEKWRASVKSSYHLAILAHFISALPVWQALTTVPVAARAPIRLPTNHYQLVAGLQLVRIFASDKLGNVFLPLKLVVLIEVQEFWNALNQEEDAAEALSAQQLIHQRNGQSGFACSSRHSEQDIALPARNGILDGAYASWLKPDVVKEGGEILVWWGRLHAILTPPGWRPTLNIALKEYPAA